MSVKGNKPSKPFKLAQYGIDILAVCSSNNEIPIPLEDAMAIIYDSFSKKEGTAKLNIQKCVLKIMVDHTGQVIIVIKKQKNNQKKMVESFSAKAMGIPQIGELSSQDLVFLPVLNKDSISELFVFHPTTASAQEVVTRLVKLLQMKNGAPLSSRSSVTPPVSVTNENVQTQPQDCNNSYNGSVRNEYNGTNDPILASTKANSNVDEIHGDYCLSPTFFNNWYCKVEQMVSTKPESLYHGSEHSSSVNDDLHILNQYLKEIRAFMNNLYVIMHESKNGRIQIAKLPQESNFVEITQKIKFSINIASAHEYHITNPPANDIVNQLILILKILTDATVDPQTQKSQLVKHVSYPQITETAVKYLSETLTTANKDFWSSLGTNYGNIEKVSPLGLYRTVVDEFEIKKTLSKPENGQHNHLGHNHNVVRSSNISYRKSPEIWRRITPNNNDRFYDSDEDRSPVATYSRPRLSASQPHIYVPDKSSPINDYDDNMINHSYVRSYNPERPKSYLTVPTIVTPQKNGNITPTDNGYTNKHSSTWENSQNRFIDAVRFRNGKLMKITRDRPAQTHKEIAVSSNEVLEVLTDYGDMLLVKNCLGEVGYCPSAVTKPMTDPM